VSRIGEIERRKTRNAFNRCGDTQSEEQGFARNPCTSGNMRTSQRRIGGPSIHNPGCAKGKEKEIVGCSALELYQQLALLRSVAVKPSLRKRGLGVELTRAALDLARECQVRKVYLFTLTACAFFSKLGFIQASRSDVPTAVRQSIEFTTLCPESATVMTIPLP